jgi:hypothetical protein
MSLLKQIDTFTRLRPLKEYLDQLEELGIDPNADDIYPNVVALFRKVVGADAKQPITEAGGRSEYEAGMDMMRGRGMDMEREKMDRLERVRRSQLDSPRLGLQAQHPAPGDWVKMSGGAGVGKVVSAKGDTVRVKTKNGFEIETPRHTLQAQAVRNPKTGENEVVWVEEIY